MATVTVMCGAVLVSASALGWLDDGGVATPDIEEVQHEEIDLLGVPTLGEEGAELGMVMFADFECQYCRMFAQRVLPALEERFIDPGLMRIAFKHLPLSAIHPGARRAAEAAACSEPGSFWLVHRRLFDVDRPLSDMEHGELGLVVGRDVPSLIDCMSNFGSATVDRDLRDARSLSIAATPTFLFGPINEGRLLARRRINGAYDAEVFDRVIRDLLEKRQEK